MICDLFRWIIWGSCWIKMEHLPIQQFQWIGLKHLQETMLACCYPKLLPKIDLFFPAVFPDLILKGLEWRRQPEEVDSYLVYLVGCTRFVGEDCGQFQQETPPTEWSKMVPFYLARMITSIMCTCWIC